MFGMGALGIGMSINLNANNNKKDTNILIKNAIIFDGQNQLESTNDVLIKNDKIVQIERNLKVPNDAKIIDAKGKFLMPGLIDCHWHTMLAAASLDNYNQPDDGLQ